MLPPCHSIAATANGEPATASAVIKETSPRLSDVEHSVFAIGSALTYLLLFWECATPPHIHAHYCTWLSFTMPSTTLVLQTTSAGVRRPGYEASSDIVVMPYS